jgi:uncharacterized protein (DUF1684 family)
VSCFAFICLALASCAKAPPPPDPEYVAAIESWREGRLQRLTAEDGWLSLTGLYWLEPGENVFGSDPASAIVLPDPDVPARAGVVALVDDGSVLITAIDEARVAVNDRPLAGDFHVAELTTDADGAPDVVAAGRIQFYIIERGDRVGARVKDPEAETRRNFQGIGYFPIDPSYRVEARFEPYDDPREVAIPTVLDEPTTMIAQGVLRFSLHGEELALEPYGEPGSESFFLIFRDGTSGDTSYGAGRFMTAMAPGHDGLTVLDFNYAYNPPCAFTAHATCPLPPPQNWLSVAIEAGEMYTGEAH